MPTVVLTLRFDAETDQAVRHLCDALSERGIREADQPRHRPHITLAAYEVDKVEQVCAVLPDLARTISAFSLRLQALGVFPDAGTVFLAPRLTVARFAVHARLLDFFGPICGAPLFPEHSLPDAWMPHCTLANWLAGHDVARTVQICLERWQPIDGRAEAIGVLVLPAKEDCCEALLRCDSGDHLGSLVE
jgi:2'-5' RNA ligase